MAKKYVNHHAPPSADDMRILARRRGTYDWLDIIQWQDEVGLRRGVIFDEDTGAVEFERWPLEVHEAVITEFNELFITQLRTPWANTPLHPIFEGIGSASKASQDHLVSKANVSDFWYPGRKKSPDSSYRPNPRPDLTNAVTAALVRMQPLLGIPWPTIVFEAGVSQTVPDLIEIRDRVLGHRTQVNIFLAVVYNQGSTQALDSWWACLAFRDLNANPPPANSLDTYPPCIVIAELAKINDQYRKVDTPLPENTVWRVPTHLLLHPEPIPALNPALPPTLDLDMEKFRQAILRNRR